VNIPLELPSSFISDFLEPVSTVDLLNDMRCAYTETELALVFETGR